MKILDRRTYVGPNLYANFRVIRFTLDLGPLETAPSAEIPGFVDGLVALIPSLAEHGCSYGEPGGFGDLAATQSLRFKAVQCEACHGPMGGHPDDGKKPPAVTIDTCTGCHDAANSPEFAFGSYLQRATCQSR